MEQAVEKLTNQEHAGDLLQIEEHYLSHGERAADDDASRDTRIGFLVEVDRVWSTCVPMVMDMEEMMELVPSEDWNENPLKGWSTASHGEEQ